MTKLSWGPLCASKRRTPAAGGRLSQNSELDIKRKGDANSPFVSSILSFKGIKQLFVSAMHLILSFFKFYNSNKAIFLRNRQ